MKQLASEGIDLVHEPKLRQWTGQLIAFHSRDFFADEAGTTAAGADKLRRPRFRDTVNDRSWRFGPARRAGRSLMRSAECGRPAYSVAASRASAFASIAWKRGC